MSPDPIFLDPDASANKRAIIERVNESRRNASIVQAEALLARRERAARVREDLIEAGIVFRKMDTKVQRRARRKARRKELGDWQARFNSELAGLDPVERARREAKRAMREASHATREAERKSKERARIAAIMSSAPGASSAHRGVKSTFNTADPGSVRREPDAPRERVSDGKKHPVVTRREDLT